MVQVLAEVVFVPKESSWRYFTGNVYPGDTWKALAFDDTAWPEGPGPLGANDTHIRTTVDIGPSGSRYPTLYFRRTFQTGATNVGSMVVDLLRDDGAVVYLNGVEIARDRVAVGATHADYANDTAGGAEETTYFRHQAATNSLVLGTNVLAVEVKNTSATSSDLGFDLTLWGNELPEVSLTSPVGGQTYNLGGLILLAATASDTDGSVAQVEFFRNGARIQTVGIAPYEYTWTSTEEGLNAFFAVATDNTGGSVTSAVATVTVVDTRPLELVAVQAITNAVVVTFNKRVIPPPALLAGNYVITPGVAVTGVAFAGPDSNAVLLAVSPALAWNVVYTLTVNGVQDSRGSPIAPNSAMNFAVGSYNPTEIGGASPSGYVVPVPGGLDVSGGGTGVDGTADQCHFEYWQQTGDFDFQVRVAGLDAAGLRGQAGLMARASLSPHSRQAAVLTSPGLSGVYFRSRATDGRTNNNAGAYPVAFPNTWVRLRRSGSAFTGFTSADGQTWAQLGAATLTNPPATMLLGLTVAGGGVGLGSTAQFRQLGEAMGGTFASFRPPVEGPGPSSRNTGIVITEFMYRPRGTGTGGQEFIELLNSQPWYEDLSGWRIAGDVDYRFPAGTRLEAGQYLVVARDPAVFQATYGFTALGPFEGGKGLPNNSGRIRLRNALDAVVLEINYGSRAPWPVAPDGAGHSLVLRRPSYGEDDPRAWGASAFIGGSPGGLDPVVIEALDAVVINEFLAHTDDPVEDYIELYNHGNVPVDLSGCWLTDDPDTNRFRIANGTTIPARGFRYYRQSELGFMLRSGGEEVFLVNSNQTRVLDAIAFEGQWNGVSSGRYPDGAPTFHELSAPSPGTANATLLIRDIVLNEIMYNPLSGEDDDEYVELHNKGAQPADLSGWRFTDGIQFELPANTVIAPGSFLVVARNAARLLTNYPHLNSANTVGDYDGSLNNGGERIALSRPDEVRTDLGGGQSILETNWVVMDEVTYQDGGQWGEWPDGGGSSLELKDPRSDNRLAQNWGDSDETAKAPWTTVEHTGLFDHGRSNDGNSELHVMLLGHGECLVDDIYAGTNSSGLNVIPNGTFEGGLGGWILHGNHIRSILANEGFQSARSLHLRATSGGDNGVNRVEADYASSLPTSGQGTVRAKARWLRGLPILLLRTKGNYLEAVGHLIVPPNLGSPGLPNSIAVPNAPPAIFDLTHTPVLPAVGETVVVTARVHDPDGIQSLTLRYRVDPATSYSAVAFRDDGALGDAIASDGIFSALIPAQSAGRLVAFFVEARDGGSPAQTAQFPVAGATRSALVRFGEPVIWGDFGTYRFWMTAANASEWTSRQRLSNEPIEGTFVCNPSRVVYNAGARYRGSPFIRPNYTGPTGIQCAYVWMLPEDEPFLGADELNLDSLEARLSGSGTLRDPTALREPLAFWMGQQVGLPFSHQRYVHLVINGVSNGDRLVPIYADTQQPDSAFMASQFPDDDRGEIFKVDDWFEFNDNSQVGREWNENGQLNQYLTTDLATGQTIKKQARYRWSFEKKFNRGRLDDDYSQLFAVVDAVNAPSATYIQRVEATLDLAQWNLVFAHRHAICDWDGYGYNRGKNSFLYFPSRGKPKFIPWDLDFSLGCNGGHGPTQDLYTHLNTDTALNLWYSRPHTARGYLHAMMRMAEGPMREENYRPVLEARYAALVANGIPSSTPFPTVPNWINQRRDYILSTVPNVAFRVSQWALGASTDNALQILGTAPLTAAQVLVNGEPWPVTWLGITSWRVIFPLAAGTNVIVINGVDAFGNLLETNTVITTTFEGTPDRPETALVLNEIHYHPVAPDVAFLELWNRSATTTFDLSGWRLRGLDFAFSPGTTVGPNKFLVVAANEIAFYKRYGPDVPLAGEFAGGLSDTGELIRLARPGASPGEELTVTRARYEAGAPWPETANGGGDSLQLRDATRDSARVSNWAAAAPTPGAPNGVAASLPSYPPLWLNEVQPLNLSGITDGQGECEPWIELYNAGTSTVSLAGCYLANQFGDPSQWAFPPGASLMPGEFKVVWADGEPQETSGEEWHTSFRLSSGAGVATLAWHSGYEIELLDSVVYSGVWPDQSHGSVPDGQPFLRQHFISTTPGASNAVREINVFINEWMASNSGAVADPADDDFDDWFELYNADAAAVDLAGYYLTDNLGNPSQFPVPPGYTIPPGGFLLVWADEETGQNSTNRPDLHVNFKLSANGDAIGLYSPALVFVDTVSFGPQIANVSQGRWPDAGSGIYTLTNPSPRAANWLGETNHPPVIAPITNRALVLGQTLLLTASATDEDVGQKLTWSVHQGPPGLAIEAVSGLMTWTPSPLQSPSSNSVVLRATDDGALPASTTTAFVVRVHLPPAVEVGLATEPDRVTLSWPTLAGHTYRLEYKEDLSALTWTPVPPDRIAVGNTLSVSDLISGATQRFYRVHLLD